jgi:hypothetical protein
MNKILSTLKYMGAAIALCATFAACSNDIDDLQKRMDSLESRVSALETQINAINANIASLSSLTSAGTINSATEKNGVWTIVLSNGQTLTLNQGSLGVGNIPIMSIDSEGYWMVDYQDGGGKKYILSNGAKVKATGNNGITPLFGVNASGNWTVSYDSGSSYTEVLGADGKPVSALPSTEVTDQYFKSVDYDSSTGAFTIVMKDGTSLTVPVVSSFLCAISGAEGTQKFAKGETKTYSVTLKGVSQTIVSAPEGWTAVLNDNILSVTAPLETKSILADTKSDVSILALSPSGYAALAKVSVLMDGSIVAVNPVAVISAGTVTSSSVTFNVTLSDALTWKYMVLKSTETAPNAATIQVSGIDGVGTSATVTGLAASTTYKIYVLPINGTTLGSVASAMMTTGAEVITDYYQAYQDGKDIVIAGVTYNLATNGAATLLSATAADTDLKASIHQLSGVFFLEQSAGASFATTAITEITGNVVLISRYVASPVTIKPTQCMKLKSGKFVSKNIVWDLSGIDGSGANNKYLFNNANATENFGALHFDGCTFKSILKPLLYASVAGFGFQSIVTTGCTLQVTATASTQLYNFYKSTVLDIYKEFIFNNNLVYNTTATAIQLANTDQTIAQTGTTWGLKASVNNNIFYNSPSSNGYFKFYQVGSLSFEKNVFWADPASTLTSYCYFFYGTGQTGTGITNSDNISYGLSKSWLYAVSTSTYVPTDNALAKLDSDPFTSFNTATGEYVLSSAYTSYGPQK